MKKHIFAILPMALAMSIYATGCSLNRLNNREAIQQQWVEETDKNLTESRAKAEELLAFIPEVVAETKDGDKVYANELKNEILPKLASDLVQDKPITEDNIKETAYLHANRLIRMKVLLKEAKANGFEPDIEKEKKELKKNKADSGMSAEMFQKYLELNGLTEELYIVHNAEIKTLKAYEKYLATVKGKDAEDYYDYYKTLDQKLESEIKIYLPKPQPAEEAGKAAESEESK